MNDPSVVLIALKREKAGHSLPDFSGPSAGEAIRLFKHDLAGHQPDGMMPCPPPEAEAAEPDTPPEIPCPRRTGEALRAAHLPPEGISEWVRELVTTALPDGTQVELTITPPEAEEPAEEPAGDEEDGPSDEVKVDTRETYQ